MTTTRQGYRDYTADGTYWTVRKYNREYRVVRIEKVDGAYSWAETWGGYTRAGAAAGAAAQLAYAQGMRDGLSKARDALHVSLDEIGLGVPTPAAPNVPAASAPSDVDLAQEPE